MDMLIFDASLISFVVLVISWMVAPERGKTAAPAMTKVAATAS